MLPFEDTLAARAAKYLAFMTALDAPAIPTAPGEARSGELARILAFDPDRLPELTQLSTELLAERDLVAGCQPGVAFDLESLAGYFQTDCPMMLSAAKLCGAMPFQRKGQTIWADDERVRFTLDAAAIEAANANLAGRA